MPNLETIVLEPTSEAEAQTALGELFTDMQIGGVMLRNCIDKTQIQQLIDDDFKNFTQADSFKYLFAQIARQIKVIDDTYSTGTLLRFVHNHGWHLAETQADPTVRVWLHLRDEAKFSLSRTVDSHVTPGFVTSIQDVIDDSFAMPASIEPTPGDALVFIDHGTPGITGNSTFHRVDVPKKLTPQAFPERLSVSCDVKI